MRRPKTRLTPISAAVRLLIRELRLQAFLRRHAEQQAAATATKPAQA